MTKVDAHELQFGAVLLQKIAAARELAERHESKDGKKLQALLDEAIKLTRGLL